VAHESDLASGGLGVREAFPVGGCSRRPRRRALLRGTAGKRPTRRQSCAPPVASLLPCGRIFAPGTPNPRRVLAPPVTAPATRRTPTPIRERSRLAGSLTSLPMATPPKRSLPSAAERCIPGGLHRSEALVFWPADRNPEGPRPVLPWTTRFDTLLCRLNRTGFIGRINKKTLLLEKYL